MTIKKIVYATDLSRRADRAGRRALQLATDYNAELLALSVVEADLQEESLVRLMRGSPEQVAQQLVDGTDSALAEHMEKLGVVEGGSVQSRAVLGNGYKTILSEAKAFGADLLVVGAHGHHHLRDIFLGTTAENLVRNTDRPILVVKNEPQGRYRKVLVPVDFSERSRHALEMATTSVAEDGIVQVLHVFNTAPLDRIYRTGADDETVRRIHQQAMAETQQDLSAFLANANVDLSRVESTIRVGYPPLVIEEAANALNAELLVMGTHGRKHWQDVLLGGVARRVVHQVRCDVLLSRGKN
ncbi:nucleotide-binding universal stress UspA family protein [Alkalispirillum mobile]|uniref:Nucleotide-binding universal stress UspA family protein n=1 Tax=Alkalispirillum mobile TaxID=85925 RepID=A0A498CB64_9GAMM|nr:universal stress protein [Alkalispirillum mobile]RLK50280.1 nucleotide-binding universal stress UspA family protein [Alkalispirillum mobile]